jgi:putative tricarboxylic transport membrane protein
LGINILPVRFTVAVLFLLLPASATGAEPLLDRLLIVAPAAPGGGWDQTARAMQHALEADGIVRRVEVQNVAGAAGTIGLAQFVSTQAGNGEALLVTGLVMLGATIWNDSPVSLGQVTPIARLTGEFEVIAVPAASPHRGMRSLATALRANPGSVSWGGGSAGGTDHILAGLIGAAVGVDPRRVNYIAFSGGGEAVAALLGGNVTAGVSGYSEFAPHIESGRLRALAVSAPERVAGIDAPTLREQGLDVDLANWRAVMGPPALSRSDRDRLTQVIARMSRSPTWRKSLADRGWIDTFQDGEAFARYLESERVRIGRIVARLRGPGATEPIRAGERIFPLAILVGSACVAALLIGKRTRAPSAPAANLRAVAWVAAGLLAFLLLLESAGFIIAAAVLFVAVMRAFGPAEAGADNTLQKWGAALAGPLVAAIFSALVYLAFTRGLDLALPAGRLWSWIP